ncbi:MAG: hypothetical protein K8S99_00255 [Planctomycetes bacterium]|nr:hypothetical protein [Planctomycetota bacterium]
MKRRSWAILSLAALLLLAVGITAIPGCIPTRSQTFHVPYSKVVEQLIDLYPLPDGKFQPELMKHPAYRGGWAAWGLKVAHREQDAGRIYVVEIENSEKFFSRRTNIEITKQAQDRTRVMVTSHNWAYQRPWGEKQADGLYAAARMQEIADRLHLGQ